jgi:transposase
MGAGTAAEMLVLVGDNPERIRSEAALTKLCGACPVPASSGKTNRHRLNRGGNRRTTAAL